MLSNEKTTRNFSQDSRSRGPDLNLGSLKHEAKVLTTRQRRSVEELGNYWILKIDSASWSCTNQEKGIILVRNR